MCRHKIQCATLPHFRFYVVKKNSRELLEEMKRITRLKIVQYQRKKKNLKEIEQREDKFRAIESKQIAIGADKRSRNHFRTITFVKKGNESNRSQIGNGKIHGATKERCQDWIIQRLFPPPSFWCVHSTGNMKKDIGITFGKFIKSRRPSYSDFVVYYAYDILHWLVLLLKPFSIKMMSHGNRIGNHAISHLKDV